MADDHELRAVLICLATAACVAAGAFMAVGDDTGGYFSHYGRYGLLGLDPSLTGSGEDTPGSLSGLMAESFRLEPPSRRRPARSAEAACSPR